jgi:hypothetical protein
MAKDDLVGNIPSEIAFPWLAEHEGVDWVKNVNWVKLTQQALGVYQGKSF